MSDTDERAGFVRPLVFSENDAVRPETAGRLLLILTRFQPGGRAVRIVFLPTVSTVYLFPRLKTVETVLRVRWSQHDHPVETGCEYEESATLSILTFFLALEMSAQPRQFDSDIVEFQS